MQKHVLKRIWQVGFIILLNILIIVFFTRSPFSINALYMGSHSSQAEEIKKQQMDWGYHSGAANGTNTNTKNTAIAAEKTGLTAAEISGQNKPAALGISSEVTAAGSVNSDDYNLLARIISAEARGEPYAGQIAVGAVVLNRVKHPSFPDTISGVIYQQGAFSALYDGQFNIEVADSAYKAAADALNGMDPSGGAIYFYNPSTATDQWIQSRTAIVTIGKHLFCE